MLGNEIPYAVDVQPHQLGGSVYAHVRPWLAHWGEAKHQFIETAMARIHLDEQVRAVIVHGPIHEDNVEQRCQPWAGGRGGIESKFREFAKLSPRGASEALDFVGKCLI